MRIASRLFLLATAFGFAGPLAAAPAAAPPPLPVSYADELRGKVQQEVALISLRAQNARHASVSQADIDRLDAQWRAESEGADQPLIAQLMGSPLSSYLIDIKARSLGLFVEIFVMDEHGLNVGQSSITSDYWQGDEDKFLQTFARGKDAVHLGEIEFDEGYKVWKQQLSFPIVDPGNGELLGAATFEINLTEWERRS